MEEDDIKKTAICTPFGLFEFPFMIFGLRNAAQTFQRFIHSVLRGLEFCFPYIDDILVASRNREEHVKHLQTIFKRFHEHGLALKLSKCNFAQSEVSFLGHTVTAKGIKPTEERIKTISNFEKPSTVKQLRRFLGMINFYRRFIPQAAQNQALLNNYLVGSKKNDNRKIQWTVDSSQAFEQCKEQLRTATTLVHPSSTAKLALMVDASNNGIGSVVQQYVNDCWQPLGFFSVRLTSSQQKYSTYDRELLAAYSSIKHFRYLLEGRNFTLFTDHKPLTFAFRQNLEKASPRQQRHLEFIAQFTTDVQHISGKDNTVADTLSRIEELKILPQIDYEALAKAQKSDTELLDILSSADSSLKLEKLPIVGTNEFLYCDTSHNKNRPYISPEFRKQAFRYVHDLAHPGIKTSVKLMTEKFVWPSIRKDAKNWAKSCINCQKSKVSRHVRSPLQQYKVPSQRFSEINLDIIGPLPSSEGYRYCLTMVDRYTRWPEAIPIADIKADTVADALVKNWIARFGSPTIISTDQGTQFESQLFYELSKLMGYKRQRTVAYHPQANGAIERWHRTVKAAIMCHQDKGWTRALPIVLLGLRTTWHTDFHSTPAELIYGENLQLPCEFLEKTPNEPQSEFVKNLKEKIQQIRPIPFSNHSKQNPFVFKDLKTCSHVFVRTDSVRRSLQPPYQGPYQVCNRTDKNFVIKIKDKEVKVSIDRIKPCFLDNTADHNSAINENPRDEPRFGVQQQKASPEGVSANCEKDPFMDKPVFQAAKIKKTVTFAQQVLPRTTRSGRTIQRPARYR